MRIGILALQGAFAEHEKMLRSLGAETAEIRQLRDIAGIDALVLPGGESTVMTKLLHELGLFEPLRNMIKNGMPVLGTCAGLILLAKEVEGGKPCFSLMDIRVKRNAYGRQLGSFSCGAVIPEISAKELPLVFIRAPWIADAGDGVEVLCEVDGHIAAARQGNMLVTAFHPELTEDTSIAQYFLSMCKKD